MQDSLLLASTQTALFQMFLQIVRYLLFAGVAYVVFWKWGKTKFATKKIQNRDLPHDQIDNEKKQSLQTIVVFSVTSAIIYLLAKVGVLKIHQNWSHYNLYFHFLSFVVLVLLHDTYFYWLHRFMHLPKIYKHVHLAHHLSSSPTPWAIYSFHPFEAILQSFFVPLVTLFIPIHVGVVIFFIFYSTYFNVVGHLGYEMKKPWFFKTGLFRWMTTTTHHDFHHQKGKMNYGFYFRFWDRWMKTENSEYELNLSKNAQITLEK